LPGEASCPSSTRNVKELDKRMASLHSSFGIKGVQEWLT
jgi:hypothetical protein